MLHLLYALALLLLLSGACAILGEKSNLSPALLPLPVLSGAVVVLYLCGIAGVLRAGAVLVLLALAAVWVLGLVQLRPAGVFKAWQSVLCAPGFALFLGGAAFICAVLRTEAHVYPMGRIHSLGPGPQDGRGARRVLRG